MLWKKLVTLASVLGILSFGACFWPAPSAPVPPLPPRLDLQGIRTIQVAVTNLSESKHLAPADLAQAVANYMNARSLGPGIRTLAQAQASTTDAVLQITILSERTELPPRAGWATFQVGISATLTRQNGQVIWRETNGSYGLSHRFTGKNPAYLWNEPKFQSGLFGALSSDLTYRLLYTI